MRTHLFRGAAGVALAIAVGSVGAEPIAGEVFSAGLDRPIYLTHAPDDFWRVFVVEQPEGEGGRIRVLDAVTGSPRAAPFLSFEANGREIRGLAFHPDHDSNRFFYVSTLDDQGVLRVSRYRVSDHDPDLADAASEHTVLRVDQPDTGNEGGWIELSRAGFLLVGLGDGGGHPEGRAQDVSGTLLGKILRIDVGADGEADEFPGEPERNYAIPVSNPFAFGGGAPEILVFGVRDPRHGSVDTREGTIWFTDVAELARDEVNLIISESAAGQNFGWPCLEGTVPTGYEGCDPESPGLRAPGHEHDRDAVPGRCGIVGLAFYRGCTMPGLVGSVFFADACSGEVFTMRYDGFNPADVTDRTQELAQTVGTLSGITSFGRDAFGEVYILTEGGTVYRVLPATGIQDCNKNGIDDRCEVRYGLARDCDGGPVGDPFEGGEFFGMNCAGCHASDGTGFFGPNIRNLSRLQIREKLTAPTDHPGGSFTLPDALYAHIESFLSDTGSRGRPDGIPDECQDLPDCNNSGVSDGCELEAGTQVDMNFDGIPDDCQPCQPADLAEPFGVLDVFDVIEFLTLFEAGDPRADLAEPFGVFDVFDVLQFLTLFEQGCP